jgi:hypothetical protein
MIEKLRISVTEDDIKRGTANDSYLCPIARAVRRLGKTRVSVDGYRIVVRNASYGMSREAQRFVSRFDIDKVVKPFTFVAKRID